MRKLLLIFCLLFSGPAFAVQPDEILRDPALEARARHLSAGLRCLICQNQSIDDSDASLAKDLRVLIRERLVAGDSDEAVIDYVVGRYGEYVLLKPRLSAKTIVLWATPFVIVLLGGLMLWRRRAPAAGVEQALTDSERAALNNALDRGAS